MALTIIQSPKYRTLAAGQEIIFAVSDPVIAAAQTGVKYKCEVVLYDTASNIGPLAATLRTTPNNAGSGIFDLRPIVESYVNSDNLGTDIDLGGGLMSTSQFKGVSFSSFTRFPIHIIDKCAIGVNSAKFLAVYFYVEYLDTATNAIVTSNQMPFQYGLLVYNGVLYNEDELSTTALGYGFGYDLNKFNFILNNQSAKFLSNAPAVQYARATDYGTVAMFSQLSLSGYSFVTAPAQSSALNNSVPALEVRMYDSAGGTLGSVIDIQNLPSTGGSGQNGVGLSASKLIYSGIYPANIRNTNTTFNGFLTAGTLAYYTVQAIDASSPTAKLISQKYTINIICDSSFGYEGIRLAWLNKFGVWDYYTFNQKSIRSLTTNKTTYTQLGGTWNDQHYKPYSHKGGKKNFRVNSTERIKLNTDFLNDEESIWIEELLNSPEVYIINGYDVNDLPSAFSSIINKYVEPVLVTTSSFTRKTRANDKLIQYTIEIERNKKQRTQAG